MRGVASYPAWLCLALLPAAVTAAAAADAAEEKAAAAGPGDKEPVQVPPPTDHKGTDIDPLEETETRFSLDGYYRIRAALFFDFDLNRGPTPSSGLPVWPETLTGDPQGGLDMRLRLAPSIHIGWGVWVHAELDLLDNLQFGQTPDTGYGFAATQQLPPEDSLKVRKAYGELLLPFGVLSAGRMGALVSWGTGMIVNPGDCLECERGDIGDRVSFVAPLLGHFLGVAFDIAAIGASSSGFYPQYPAVNIDRKDDVRSIAATFFRYDDPPSLRRKLGAGKVVVNYGLLFAARWQEYDVGAVEGEEVTPDQLIWRGATSYLGDLWLRVNWKGLRVELEYALLGGKIENASTDPGVEIVPAITALQMGGVLQAGWESPLRRIGIQLDLVYASGDPEYGMGANPDPEQVRSLKGDLDGPQFSVPDDTKIENFRFNPDFLIDHVFWRRIVGRITDAFIVRPTLRYRPADGLELSASSVTSMAIYASSTPGGSNYLGTELSVSIRYLFEPGFLVQGTYALFIPGAGMNNTGLNLNARPAHLASLLLAFRF